jgi:autotransporter-associated beta strand protein
VFAPNNCRARYFATAVAKDARSWRRALTPTACRANTLFDRGISNTISKNRYKLILKQEPTVAGSGPLPVDSVESRVDVVFRLVRARVIDRFFSSSMRSLLPNRRNLAALVSAGSSMRKVLVGAALGLCATAAYGQNATWLLSPGSSDFDTAANWSPATVPTGTASFGASNKTSLTFSLPDTIIGSMQFNGGAPAYSFAVSSALEITGNGIVNNSSNAPTVNNTGGGGTFFENASTAANATITNSGAGSFVEFSNNSTAGTANINNNTGGNTFFLNASTAGTANITINSGSVLEFNDSSTAGNAVVVTNSGGITAFQNTAGGGQAQFITNAGGTFDISGLSSSGLTVGSIAGAGSYNLGSKQLTVGSNNLSTVVSGQITDGGLFGGVGGSLVKIGSGTLVLSGANTYTGPTNVNGGTLEVDGSIAASSSVTVNTGGTLAGTGVVDPATTTIMSGGTLAPGNASNATGTLTLAGNLVFQSAATYLITVSGAKASNTQVTSIATLGGTVQASFASAATAKTYDILRSAGLGGTTFSGASSSNPNYAVSLSYTPTDVLLNVSAQLGGGGGLNPNQQAVASGINTALNNGATLPAALGNIFGLTGGALANALTQLDGEAATGAERGAFQMTDQFLSLMLDPFVYGRAGGFSPGGGAIGFAPEQEATLPPDVALAYASILSKAPPQSFDQRWTAWGSAYGGANNANGDPAVGSTNVTARTFGFAAGMDYHVTPNTIVGFALAGGGLNWGLANAMGGGRSDALQTGVYGISYLGPAYLAGALAFTNHWFTTSRSALGDALSATFIGQSYGGRLEGGYRFGVLPSLGVAPYAAVQAQDFRTPAYSESDLTNGGLGLSYAAMNATDVRTELGSRLDAPTLVAGLPLILRGRIAWAHDFVSNPALSAAFETLPGGNFTVNGAPIPHDSALTSAGAELFLTPRWTLLAKFDGEFANGSQTYAGSGTLRYAW